MLRLLLLFVVPLVICETALNKYYVRKDWFHFFKAGEFEIFNPGGSVTHYRIESNYGLSQLLELVSYPSKQVVGKLTAKITLLLYEAAITVLDTRSKKWMNGTINANFQFFESKFTIKWNDRHLIMVSGAFSLTTNFYDEQQPDIILARFTKRFESYFFVNKFDMEIFTKDIPEAVFLLGLAVKDHNRRTGHKS